MFNGRDLTGWGYRPTTDADKESASSLPRSPGYRVIQQLWTERECPEDFVLKLEFRATPFADSGLYLRRTQLQVRDYGLAGPYTTLKSYRPQDWNELVVTVRGGVAEVTCNGEVLEKALKIPATGPIGLEGDRGQTEYRRLRIR